MNSKVKDIETVYSRLSKQLHNGNMLHMEHELETSVKNYSLAKFVLGKGNRYKALISAGIHGDEPSGVETICSFLENNRFENFSDTWELTILPCLNPYGYEYGVRENHRGEDLNRFFRHDSPPEEVRFAQSAFDKNYELTIELHEDSMTPGFYLYQKGTHQEDDILGNKILTAIKNVMPINHNGEIDGHSAQGGIIIQQTDWTSMDWWPMAFYALSKGTRRTLTLETATGFAMQTRAEAHLIAIETALKFYTEKLKS